MGDKDFYSHPPAPHDPFAGVRLIDAPILLFVVFHKAFSAELDELKKLAVEVAEREAVGFGDGQCQVVVNGILRRFEFLKLVYQYHCAAEDEVVFLALNGRVKNVACTYSLEHRSVDDLFSSLFDYLKLLVEAKQGITKGFQELVFRIGTIQTAICKHMHKEEKQVFPLLVQHLTIEEQASLVWQFICSVPIGLLEEFFSWTTNFLPPNEQVDVRQCMQIVVPEEIFLQEVVLSWLDNTYTGGSIYTSHEEHLQDVTIPYKALHQVHSADQWAYKSPQTNVNSDLVSLHIWHGAILHDFNEILVELYQARASDSFSSVVALIIQLKFLVDVVIFYRNALDKALYPFLDGVSKSCSEWSTIRLLTVSHTDSLQRSLYYHLATGTTVHKFVGKLCWEVDSLLKGISKHFAFIEREILPLIRKFCSYNTHQSILCASLRIMPLGLLKCTITWLMSHLSENESRSVLHFIEHDVTVLNKTFASLLNGWVRAGYSAKTSVQTFRKDLHEMFSCRCSYITDQTEGDIGPSSSNFILQPSNKPNPMPVFSKLAADFNNHEATPSTFGFRICEKNSTLYSSRISMRMLSPDVVKTSYPFPEFLSDLNDADDMSDSESRPVDYLFYFHKALKKDLENLAFKASELAENAECLVDFIQRFNLLRFLYQLHSAAEDEIAFPALEAKGKEVENISFSYTIDHQLEADYFNMMSALINDISLLKTSDSEHGFSGADTETLKYHHLCVKLHDMCISMNKVLCDHIDREEIELWPLFRECFSIQEQEQIVGYMLGRLNAEILQQMIPWLMASLTPEEQNALILIWRKATKNTKFDEWLRAWWGGVGSYEVAGSVSDSNMQHASMTDPLEIVYAYLSKQGTSEQGGNKVIAIQCSKHDSYGERDKCLVDSEENVTGKSSDESNHTDHSKLHTISQYSISDYEPEVVGQHKEPSQLLDLNHNCSHQERLLRMSQEELESVIIKISKDSSLDPQKKSYMMQNLLMSRWIATQRSQLEGANSEKEDEVPGQCPSYHDPILQIFGCKHYKRNCKLLAVCCNKLYPCIRCHDEEADHSIDRDTIAQMMCMKCLAIQPIGPTCSTDSCNSFSMGKYYCSNCKLFDDGREIYHCPYCNLCRVGRGLGIDFFHCMNCNACMSRSLTKHICREKCFEDNCPICREYIFTSSSPIKALPCGHLMHSSCFQDYTCTHYTCPICSKSLGDMQLYFGMIDAMLAEEKIPDEYSNKTRQILCNDCGKKATAPYHWMYHKCPNCGSYNTTIL